MTSQTTKGSEALPFPVVRADLPVLSAFDWLARGWDDLKACRNASIFYGVCFVVMGWLLVIAFNHAVHLVSAITAGFMLVGPFLAIGLYALSRQREAGEPVRLRPTLTAWRTTRGAIGVYSLILIIIYLIWARASMVSFALFYEGSMPTLQGMLKALFTFQDLEFFAMYTLVGGFFATFVFALSVVSVPLMLDRDQDAVTAMIVSVLATGRNLPAVLVWAALIATLMLLGTATGFLGMVIAGPWVGHATWHAFRALVEPLPPAPPIDIATPAML